MEPGPRIQLPSLVTDEKRGQHDDGLETPVQSIRLSREEKFNHSKLSVTTDGQHEANEADLRRLGRARPAEFTSTWMEVGFVTSIAVSMIFDEYLMSGFLALVPKLMDDLELTNQDTTWPSSVPSLVVSALLLTFGRLADMYGGFPVYMAGLTWALIWSIIAGFAVNVPMLIVCRAMQGLGAAAHLPAGLMMLGRLYYPGPRKNLVFSIYGAMAPFGFFIGILAAGLVSRYIRWEWYFWIAAMIAFVAIAGAYFTTPPLQRTGCKDLDLKMDWYGAVSLAAGLILIVFAITEAPDAPQGWRTAYVPLTLILGVLCLAITWFVEARVAAQPLLPASVFRVKHIRPLLIGCLFSYGTVGLYVCYASLYIRNIIGIGPLQLVAWFAPLAIVGCFLAILGGMVMHYVAGTVILIVTCFAIMAAGLLFAFVPVNPTYWIWIFPAMICATIAIDLIVTVVSVFLSTQLPEHQQGLAGGLAHVLMQFSVAFLLGLAKMIQTYTSDQGEAQSYKNCFWLQFGCGVATLITFAGFVRIRRADGSEGDLEGAASQEQLTPVSPEDGTHVKL